MKIKEGYNGQPIEISIQGPHQPFTVEVWLNQPGIPEDGERYRSTLSYASLDEIIALRDECNDAIKRMAGL